MTAPDPADERFRAGLLASASRDAAPPQALDRELARLGLATVAAGATLAVVAGSTPPGALPAAGAGAAGLAGAGGGPAAAGAAKLGVGAASSLSALSLTKFGVVVALALTGASAYFAVREPGPATHANGVNATAATASPASAAPDACVAPAESAASAASAASAVPPAVDSAASATLAVPPAVNSAASDGAERLVAAGVPSNGSTGIVRPAPTAPGDRARTTPSAPAAASSVEPASRGAAAASPSFAPSASAEATATLAAEVVLVDRARALARSSPSAALAALDEHARRFPTGALRDEAAVVRIEALVAAGRRAEAERYAAPYLGDRAGTPIAHRMSSLLGP